MMSLRIFYDKYQRENVNLRYGIGSIFISVFNFVFKIREFGGRGLLLFLQYFVLDGSFRF